MPLDWSRTIILEQEIYTELTLIPDFLSNAQLNRTLTNHAMQVKT